jgi:hypothetical protein
MGVTLVTFQKPEGSNHLLDYELEWKTSLESYGKITVPRHSSQQAFVFEKPMLKSTPDGQDHYGN